MAARLALLLLVALSIGCCCVATPPTCNPSYPYRSYDGTCNNLLDTGMGSAGRFFTRGIEGAEFEDGVSLPFNSTRPNVRVVSNALCRTNPDRVDHNRHSMFSSHFGQFVNHDIEDNRNTNTHPQNNVFDILIWIQEYDDDHCFGPVSRTNSTIRNYCATGAPQRFRMKSSDGEIVHNRFEVPNDATSWLDLSSVYGKTVADANVLRTFSGGRLKTQDYSGVLPVTVGFPPNTNFTLKNMPPSHLSTGLPLDQNSFTPFTLFNLDPGLFFSAGDMRLNENVGLLTFHVLFLREHNRLAAAIQRRHPGWNDEKIFQEARQLNIAQYQNTVLYQYLPTVLGSFFLKVGPYKGYEPNRNVDTDIAFASAAFRYGHVTLRDYNARDECGRSTLMLQPSEEKVPFIGQIGGPITPVWNVFRPGSIENVIRGLIATKNAPITPGASESIRNIKNNPGGTDIMSLDFMRARLNGIPNYVKLRDAYNEGEKRLLYGLPGCPEWYQREPELTDPIACFNYITDNNTINVSPPESSLAYKLQQVYKKANRIDALIGLVSEPPAPGSSFPPTLGNMFVATYSKLRNADRFWFERIYKGADLLKIRRTTLGDLVRNNFPNVGVVPDNPLLTPNNYLAQLALRCR